MLADISAYLSDYIIAYISSLHKHYINITSLFILHRDASNLIKTYDRKTTWDKTGRRKKSITA